MTEARNTQPDAFSRIATVVALVVLPLILLAFFFPANTGHGPPARRAIAAINLQAGVTAIKQYYVEYGQYPDVAALSIFTASTSTAQEDGKVGDKEASILNRPNSLLFNILERFLNLPTQTTRRTPGRSAFLKLAR